MKEPLINGQRAVIAHHQPAEVAKPGDGAFHGPSPPYADRRQRRRREPDFRRGSSVKVASHRNTRAVDPRHPLRPLAPLGFADSRALFSPERNSRPETLRSISTAGVHSTRPETPARSRAKPLAPPRPAVVASRSMARETPRANPASERRCAVSTKCLRALCGRRPEAARRAGV